MPSGLKQDLLDFLFMASIPFRIILAAVTISIGWLVERLVPVRVRDWFGRYFEGPGGWTRKPFDKWDVAN